MDASGCDVSVPKPLSRLGIVARIQLCHKLIFKLPFGTLICETGFWHTPTPLTPFCPQSELPRVK